MIPIGSKYIMKNETNNQILEKLIMQKSKLKEVINLVKSLDDLCSQYEMTIVDYLEGDLSAIGFRKKNIVITLKTASNKFKGWMFYDIDIEIKKEIISIQTGYFQSVEEIKNIIIDFFENKKGLWQNRK